MKARRLAASIVLVTVLGASALLAAPPETRVSVRLADAVLARWPDPVALSTQGWEYNAGIVLRGIAEVWRVTKDPRYLAYVTRWVDRWIATDGRIDLGDDAGGHNLDRIQPGVLLLLLYEETGDPRYARAAMWLRARFDDFPRNRAGGFWHKKKYPEEMWLDGLYMAQPFLVRFGTLFGEPAFAYDTAVRQTLLLAAHARVGDTGLFRHAWDEDRNAAWADPETGLSPVVWSRAMGWFAMELVDVLEALPPSHPGHPKLVALLRDTARGIRATQDPTSGLWFQVMDGRDVPDNWLETSASAMFVYTLRKGVDLGLLDAAADGTAARRGWDGIRKTLGTDDAGRPVVRGAVEGMSVQKDVAGYLGRRRLENSPHGLCGVLLAAARLDALPVRDRR